MVQPSRNAQVLLAAAVAAAAAGQGCSWDGQPPLRHGNSTGTPAINNGDPWLQFDLELSSGPDRALCLRFGERQDGARIASLLPPGVFVTAEAPPNQSVSLTVPYGAPGPGGLQWEVGVEIERPASSATIRLAPRLAAVTSSATVADAWLWLASLSGTRVVTLQAALARADGLPAEPVTANIQATLSPGMPGHGRGTLWPERAPALTGTHMADAVVSLTGDVASLTAAVSRGPGVTPVTRVVDATRVAERAAADARAAGGADDGDVVTDIAGQSRRAVRPEAVIAAVGRNRDASLPTICRDRAGPILPRDPAQGRSSAAELARGWEAPLPAAEFRERLASLADAEDACSRVGVVVAGGRGGSAARLWGSVLSQWAGGWYVALVAGPGAASAGPHAHEEAVARFHGPRAGWWGVSGAEAAALTGDSSVDLVVFERGARSRAEVRGWWRALRPGGLLAGDAESLEEGLALERATGARLGTTFGDATATWFVRK